MSCTKSGVCENASSEKLCYAFDTDLSEEGQVSLVSELQNNISTLQLQDEQFPMVNVNARAVSKSDYYALYGGLFFLGILLGSVFIFGMILIIYYKQITEGYEDQGRFSILWKVGMTRKEVRRALFTGHDSLLFTAGNGPGSILHFHFRS